MFIFVGLILHALLLISPQKGHALKMMNKAYHNNCTCFCMQPFRSLIGAQYVNFGLKHN